MNYGKCTSEQLLEAMRELQKENSILEEASVKNLAETSHIQKALDESKEKYNFLFANNPQPMLIYDLTTLAILEVNQAIVDHYGYSRDEFLLMTIKDIRPAEDIPELLKDLEIARLTNNPLNEWRHKKKNGEIIFVEITAYSVEYKGRKARHVLVHDITRQMSAQVDGNKAVESLRNERLLLRTLIDNIPDSIYCKDVACRKTLVNLAELRFMGAKSESEVLGKDDFDFYPRELAEKFYADDQSVIQTGKPVLNREEYVLDETGQKIWLLSSKLPLRDKDGHIIGLVGMGRNITDRKRVEEDLKENEERHRTILQTAMDGFLLVDTKGKMLEVNSTYCRMSGYTEQELLNTCITDLESSPLSDGIVARMPKIRVQGEDRFETRHRRKDGSIFDLEVSIQYQPAEGGRFVSFVHDISKRKRDEAELILAKERAEESDRLKSAFLANMSHEIRTPMNGILGFTELLKMPDLTGEQQQEYIQIIKKSGERMLNIINDIVDISKIEAGLMEISASETNINEQIEYVYTFFKPEAENKGISFSFRNNLPAKQAIITTDREKLYAILINLVKNAIKYTDKGSIEFGYILKPESQQTQNKADVQADSASFPAGPAELEFFVKDSGIGIVRERQSAIFDRFVQADNSDARAFEGAGLGLSITKAYLEMLGGKIRVESEEGKGSVFYFTLPYNSVHLNRANANTVISTEIPAVGLKKLKIVIAEDDETSAILIALAVRTFSKQVFMAQTGIEAVEACRNNPDIDLVLMDVKMPGMDGYEATRQIRRFNKSVFIIAQTAFGLNDENENAIKAGCNQYVSKPLDIVALRKMIEKHFEL